MSSPTTIETRTVRWGLREALGGWFFAFVFAGVVGFAVLQAGGYDEPDEAPLWLFALASAPLHLALLAVVVWAGEWRGTGVIRDFRLGFDRSDLWLGIAVALVSSIGLGLLYQGFLRLVGEDADKVDDVARDLTDRADDPVGVVALVLLVSVLAPVVEELFFRGLVFRSFERRLGTTAAVITSGVFFGGIHFQALQFPVLAALGIILALLVARTGRLGPAIVCHVVFNTMTVVTLLTLDDEEPAEALVALLRSPLHGLG